jgi:hypothetical protein
MPASCRIPASTEKPALLFFVPIIKSVSSFDQKQNLSIMKKCYLMIITMAMLITHHGYAQLAVCQTPEASIQSTSLSDFNRYVSKFKAHGRHLNRDLLLVPTVIHVIYRNSADSQEISWERIQSQLVATNKQLRRLNENANETRDMFLPVADDCDIQVCLATRKPNRSSFNGVIYHKVQNTIGNFDSIFAATILDPERYMNVWVMPGSGSARAEFPWQENPTKDGFWIGARIFGTFGDNLEPGIDLGVTFTHEVGHYLGLLHTFDESINYREMCNRVHDGSIGDFCSDTPLDWELYVFFNSCIDEDGHQTCPDSNDDFYIQTENYMYYAWDSCLNMFSKDQRARMRACLAGLRHKLSSRGNLNFTGVSCSSIQSSRQLLSATNEEAAESETPGKNECKYIAKSGN